MSTKLPELADVSEGELTDSSVEAPAREGRAIVSATISRMLVCSGQNCDEEFRNQETYNQHWARKHVPHLVVYECSFFGCASEFTSIKKYRKHLEGRHGDVIRGRGELVRFLREVPKLGKLAMNREYQDPRPGKTAEEVRLPFGVWPTNQRTEVEEKVENFRRHILEPLNQRNPRAGTASWSTRAAAVPVDEGTELRHRRERSRSPIHGLVTARDRARRTLRGEALQRLMIENRDPAPSDRRQVAQDLRQLSFHLLEEASRLEVSALEEEKVTLQQTIRGLRREVQHKKRH